MDEHITIIFSRNRALQLHCCLTTLKARCSDIEKFPDIRVLYKVNDLHRESYEILKKEFPEIEFLEEKNFREDLLSFLPNKTTILWCCDDTIFIEDFSIEKVISNLSENVLGFSLRLGENCEYCYPLDKMQKIPDFSVIDEKSKIIEWDWTKAEWDFGYPLEVSASLYKVDDMLDVLAANDFINPNSMESVMSVSLSRLVESKPMLRSYRKSVAFSNPLNKTQDWNGNRCGDVDADDLLKKFMDGWRMSEEFYYHHKTRGAHELIPVVMEE